MAKLPPIKKYSENDMQESDEEEEEVEDVEEDEVEEDEGDEDGEDDGEGEEEGDDDEEMDEIQSDDDIQTSPVKTPQTKLKITLKLPANAHSGTSAGTATPDEMDYAAFKRTPKRRAKAKVIQDVDLESEDEGSGSDFDDLDAGPTAARAGPSTINPKTMTARQAVLASVVDSSHVSLNEGSRSKKQPLNETELALRREETARKRKNLSEKKLEDEKAETIHRLLKKQSRPRNKRANTDSALATPKKKGRNQAQEDNEDPDADEDDEVDENGNGGLSADGITESVAEVKPVMYRWVSSLRDDGQGKTEMCLSFSVPEIVFPHLAKSTPNPHSSNSNSASRSDSAAPSDAMDVDPSPLPVSTPPIDPKEEQERLAREEKERMARLPGVCAVPGCGQPRKYRVPKDWTVGACGVGHLKVVAAGSRTKS